MANTICLSLYLPRLCCFLFNIGSMKRILPSSAQVPGDHSLYDPIQCSGQDRQCCFNSECHKQCNQSGDLEPAMCSGPLGQLSNLPCSDQCLLPPQRAAHHTLATKTETELTPPPGLQNQGLRQMRTIQYLHLREQDFSCH